MTNLPCLTSVWPGNKSDSRNSSYYLLSTGGVGEHLVGILTQIWPSSAGILAWL